MIRLVALIALLAPGDPGDGPRPGEGAPPLEVGVPRMDGAAAQLAYARRLKRGMQGKEGEERAFWRNLAVEAYRAVRVFHPEESALGAESAFRAGELLRAGEDGEAAREEFLWAARHGGGTPFRARARLELGHLHRRAERTREALDAYLGVASDPSAEARHRDDAWLWAGRSWRAKGRLDDARRAWRGVAGSGEDPLDRVLAYDYLALLAVEEGDPEDAVRILDECLQALSALALEETESGERVRKSLLRMRVHEVLRARIALKTSGRKVEKVLTR